MEGCRGCTRVARDAAWLALTSRDLVNSARRARLVVRSASLFIMRKAVSALPSAASGRPFEHRTAMQGGLPMPFLGPGAVSFSASLAQQADGGTSFWSGRRRRAWYITFSYKALPTTNSALPATRCVTAVPASLLLSSALMKGLSAYLRDGAGGRRQADALYGRAWACAFTYARTFCLFISSRRTFCAVLLGTACGERHSAWRDRICSPRCAAPELRMHALLRYFSLFTYHLTPARLLFFAHCAADLFTALFSLPRSTSSASG